MNGVTLLGRERELSAIRSAFNAVVDGHGPRLVLLRGEPGIGKTALMDEFLRSVVGDARTLTGGCTEVSLVPYQPFIEALRGSRLQMPDRPATGTDSDRFLFFNAVADELAQAAASMPVVLGLDDLHWADPHSVELLEHLLRTPALARALIIGTYRDTDLVDVGGGGRRLAQLASQPATDVVDVPGWTADEIAAYLRAVLDDVPAAAGSIARGLVQETGGNPFFVRELVQHMVDTNRLNSVVLATDIGLMRLPDSVRDVVLARVSSVGDDALRVLSTAAVVGTRFDATLIATVSGIHPDAASDALERAAQVALVKSSDGTQHAFTHALVRHALYDHLSAVRRSREHVRVGDALERRFAEMAAEHAAELAHHFIAGRDQRAAEYARRAGDAALGALAPQDAVRWYSIAFELSQRSDDRARALLGLGDAQRQAGVAEFRTTLLAAAELAIDLGDIATLTAAALANSRGFASMTGAADDERVHVLETALASLPDDRAHAADRARLMALLALELGWGYDVARVRTLSDEALSIARGLDDPAVVRDVLARRVMAIWSPSSLDERVANTAELERTSRASGDIVGEFWACFYRVAVSLEAADGKELRRCLERANELADAIGQPLLRWTMLVTRCWVTLLHGDVDAAEAMAEAALEQGSALGQADALPIYAALLFGIRWQQDRVSELLRLIQAGVRNFPDMPTYQATLGWAYVESDQVDDALPLLHAAAERGFVAPELVWLVTTTLWATVAAAGADSEAAATLYDLLLPWREQTVFSGANAHGPVAYYLGVLARVLGKDADAAAHFKLAAQKADAIGSSFFKRLADVS